MFAKFSLLFIISVFGLTSINAQQKEIHDFYTKGMENLRKNNPAEAIKDFSEIIKLDAGYYQAYMVRGNAYMRQKQYDLALSDYSTSLALNPKSIGNYINLGSVYRAKKEYEKALEILQRGEELDSQFPYIYSSRAGVYSQMKDYDKTIKNYDKAIELKRSPEFLTARCSAQFSFERYENAVADCSEAILLNNKETMAYYFRGMSRVKIEQKALAINDLRKALELNPQLVTAKTTLEQLLKDSQY